MNVSKESMLRWVTRLAPLVFVALAFAPAAGGELEPNGISPAGMSAAAPEIASDGHGNVVVVWRELDGDDAAIRAAVKPAGEEWRSSKRISRPAAATESPDLAMDRQGNAVVVWNRSSNGHDNVVQAALLSSDGDWGAPQDLSAQGEVAFNADVAVEGGKATAVWLAMRNRHTAVMSSSRIAGAWTPPETISGPVGNTSGPVVAMDSEGRAVAAWQWFDGVFLVVQASARSADGRWSKPETLATPGRSTTRPQVVMDAKGNALVGWIRFNGTWPTAQVAYRPAGGSWRAPTNLSNRGGKVAGLDLAMSQDGDAVAIWTQRSGRYRNIWSSSRPAGAAHWGGRANVAERWMGPDADVAIDAEGNATVAWAGSGTVSASFKPAGESWQENYLLSSWDDNSVQPAVTAQSARNAAAVWVALADEDDRIQSVTYDIDTSAKEHKESDNEDECEDDDSCGDDEDDGEMLMGTAQADTLIGTPGNDVIYGRGGGDVIDGRGGRDVIYGGRGNDRIVGGNGRDRIFGGTGFDRIAGQRGNDRLKGGPGGDRLSGGRGRDVLAGGGGSDQLRGNSGDDTLLAQDRRRDQAFGGSGLDLYRLDRWLDRARSIESRY